MRRMVPLKGRITDRLLGYREVRGFAFQVPGFEWFHTWATPYDIGGWVATHWESGMSVGALSGVRAETAKGIMPKVRVYLEAKGPDKVRERMKELGWLK